MMYSAKYSVEYCVDFRVLNLESFAQSAEAVEYTDCNSAVG